MARGLLTRLLLSALLRLGFATAALQGQDAPGSRPGQNLRVLAACMLTALFAASGLGQDRVEVKGFKFADYFPPPHELQMSWLLQGERAQPLADGRTYNLEQATLQTFVSSNGQPQLIMSAPQCFLFRPQAREAMKPSARSAGPIQVRTADGQFSIEGVGFLSQESDASLIISNRVHSVVRAAMLGGQTPGATARTSSNATFQIIDIFSDHFDYSTNSGLASYRDHVRLTGTNLLLNSGLLECKLPSAERRLQRITAQTNVALDYDLSPGAENHLHATGDKAVYQVDSGLIHVTGQPAWRAGGRHGSGDELVIDSTNRIFRALNHAALTLPAAGMETSAFLPSPTPGAAHPTTSTNHFVEVTSDSHEIHTNAAFFQGHVRVTDRLDEQPRGTMDCGSMSLAFQGSNVQSMVALDHVVFQHAQGEMRAGKAVYAGAIREMELTQNPTWRGRDRDGKRELSGKGDKILLNSFSNNMTVVGNASMRLPASNLSRAVTLGGGAGAESQPQPKPRADTNEMADIFSSEYQMQSTNAVFRGGVYVSHPQMNLVCETMSVQWPPEGGQIDALVAEEKVSFDLIGQTESTNQLRKIHGTGDRAIFSYLITPTPTNTLVTNSILRLFGNPATLQTQFATNSALVTNRVMVLDLIKNKLVAQGDYAITGTAPANTNKGSPSIDKLFK